MIYKGYKDLKYYIQGKLPRIFISDLAKKFPPHEKYLLTAHIIDSSRSITSNIAEGYGRFTYTDTRNFFYNSQRIRYRNNGAFGNCL